MNRPGKELKDIQILPVLLSIILLAAALRLYQLDLRPVHFDEGGGYALQALGLLEKGEYFYDPLYHGPFAYHIIALSFYLLGVSDTALRMPAALFGIALIPLLLPFRRYLSNPGFLVTCSYIAVSPSLLYYARFALTDSFFLFFTVSTIICAMLYAEKRTRSYLFLFWASLALLYTVKENANIVVFMLASYLLLEFPRYLYSMRKKPRKALYEDLRRASDRLYASWNTIFKCYLIFFSIYILLYSSFLRHIESVPTIFDPILRWITKATVEGRFNGPTDYYLRILAQIEQPLLFFGICGAVVSIIGRNPHKRFFGYWAFFSVIVYSAMPYKLPNLITNITLPLAITSGLFADELFSRTKNSIIRILLSAVFVFGALLLLSNGIDLSFVHYADEGKNPLAFVQTTDEINGLLRDVDSAAYGSGEGINMSLQVSVFQTEYPLSWHWRNYPNAVFLHEKIGLPTHWRITGLVGDASLIWTSGEKRTGKKSIIISSVSGSGGQWRDNVSVSGGKEYLFSAWIKTYDVEAIDNSTEAQIQIRGMRSKDILAETKPLSKTNDWTHKNLEFYVPPNVSEIWIICTLAGKGKARGTVWFDDLSLEPKGLTGVNMLNNPGFEDGNITGDTFNATVIVISENDGQKLESIQGYEMRKYLLRPGVMLAAYYKEGILQEEKEN